jgi:hypothetical protein
LSNLEDAKQLAEKYMVNQLEMMKKLSTLTTSETKEFNDWFRSHKLFADLPIRMAELHEKRQNSNKNKMQ